MFIDTEKLNRYKNLF